MTNIAKRRIGALAALVVALAAGAFLRPSAALAVEAGSVTIVHTNDSHGGYGFTSESGAPVGYYAAVAGLADSTDADLLLDAGDTFHGDSFATITNGESVARLMKAAGYDATTPGNHDWSYGSEQLQTLSAQVPVLAANVLAFVERGKPCALCKRLSHVLDVVLDECGRSVCAKFDDNIPYEVKELLVDGVHEEVHAVGGRRAAFEQRSNKLQLGCAEAEGSVLLVLLRLIGGGGSNTGGLGASGLG